MIVRRIARRSSAAIVSLLWICLPAISLGQGGKTGTPATTVYSNPRASSDDPRIGLKGGYQDAGEAASGLVPLVTLPKPPGFAPGDTAGPPPTPPPSAEGGGRGGPPPVQYGSTNSDLAFS